MSHRRSTLVPMFKPRRHLDHEPPHWIPSDADYFITICAQSRGQNHLCHPDLGREILNSVQFYNRKHFWFCDLALLMPDHVHLLVSFAPDRVLAKVVGMWKRSAARQLGVSWQRNFFEHRIRNEENLQSKADYILHNPVRAGLAPRPQDWPYVWMPSADGTSAATLKAPSADRTAADSSHPSPPMRTSAATLKAPFTDRTSAAL